MLPQAIEHLRKPLRMYLHESRPTAIIWDKTVLLVKGTISMSNQRLRVGVIGAGIGAIHLAAYAQLPEVEIVALAGLDDDRVRRVAAEYNVPRSYREYEQLLAAPDIDAVSICLPNALHATVSIAALQ